MDGIKDLLKVKRNLIGLIVFVVLLIALPFILYLVRVQQIFKPKAVEAPLISRRVAVTIQTSRGTISNLNLDNLVVQLVPTVTDLDPIETNFSLTNTRDYQRIISGSIEADNAVTVPASRTNLQVGQQVLVIWDKNATDSAKAVYILGQ